MKPVIFKEPQPKEKVDFEPVWEMFLNKRLKESQYTDKQRYWLRALSRVEWRTTKEIAILQRKTVFVARWHLLNMVQQGIIETRKRTLTGNSTKYRGEPVNIREWRIKS